MVVTGRSVSAVPEPLRLSEVLRQSPGWSWGNPITEDPLLRADDKGFGEMSGRPDKLALLLRTIQDERTRRDILHRAELRCLALERQVVDARAVGLPCLASGAERELADQRMLVLRLTPNH